MRRGHHIAELEEVVGKFGKGERLEAKYRGHGLEGERKGQRDCHIRPAMVLIYEIDKKRGF